MTCRRGGPKTDSTGPEVTVGFGFSVHLSLKQNPRAMGDTEALKKQNEKLMEQIKTLSIRLAQGSAGEHNVFVVFY